MILYIFGLQVTLKPSYCKFLFLNPGIIGLLLILKLSLEVLDLLYVLIDVGLKGSLPLLKLILKLLFMSLLVCNLELMRLTLLLPLLIL